jgi:Helix-turn-helix domain
MRSVHHQAPFTTGRRVTWHHLFAEATPWGAPRSIDGDRRREGALVDVEDARTIGPRLRQIRKSRDKSLVVIAGLAGMSKSKLDRVERGEVALNRLS